MNVYVIHNLINNKIYVGKSSDYQKRWLKHIRVATGSRDVEKFVIHKAIAKYGVENFSFSLLQLFDNEIDCNAAEIYWISYFKSNIKEFGYNLTAGGEGVSGRVMSEETKQKIREKATGRKHTPETIINISGDNNHHSKLKIEDIKEIRSNYSLNTLKQLSEKYKVSARTIARVIYNQDWVDETYAPPNPRKINNKGTPKLTQEKVDIIRKMNESGISRLEISKLFNVTKNNIRAIVLRKTWNK